jgi:hypothetical protein
MTQKGGVPGIEQIGMPDHEHIERGHMLLEGIQSISCQRAAPSLEPRDRLVCVLGHSCSSELRTVLRRGLQTRPIVLHCPVSERIQGHDCQP